MTQRKENISPDKYWNLLKEHETLQIKTEQINALACALVSMVNYASDSKWGILADMIKELSS